MKKIVTLSVLLSTLLLLSAPVVAGIPVVVGSLSYGPNAATEIPALSGTMLLVLSVLIATFGYLIINKKDDGARRMMLFSFVAVGCLASALGGIKLISDAQARNNINHELINKSGIVDVGEWGINVYTNATDIDVRVNLISIDPGHCPNYPSGAADECVLHKIIAVDGQCTIDCSQPPDA